MSGDRSAAGWAQGCVYRRERRRRPLRGAPLPRHGGAGGGAALRQRPAADAGPRHDTKACCGRRCCSASSAEIERRVALSQGLRTRTRWSRGAAQRRPPRRTSARAFKPPLRNRGADSLCFLRRRRAVSRLERAAVVSAPRSVGLAGCRCGAPRAFLFPTYQPTPPQHDCVPARQRHRGGDGAAACARGARIARRAPNVPSRECRLRIACKLFGDAAAQAAPSFWCRSRPPARCACACACAARPASHPLRSLHQAA